MYIVLHVNTCVRLWSNLRIYQTANMISPIKMKMEKLAVGTTTSGTETLQSEPVKPLSQVQEPVPSAPITSSTIIGYNNVLHANFTDSLTISTFAICTSAFLATCRSIITISTVTNIRSYTHSIVSITLPNK